MKKERFSYVLPIGDYTNRCIAEYLDDRKTDAEKKKCVRGAKEPIGVWEMTHDEVLALVESRKNLNFRFKVYESTPLGDLEESLVSVISPDKVGGNNASNAKVRAVKRRLCKLAGK
ncbi:hypothetical protein KGQ27_01865 [Patescibacteria group bacterium]|nr:hypothetical protein [Patescibacteria group bacterium]MDE1946336.1 hypothetical protein [Patescibacteria group bacterium]MDE2010788.1 hypothetical protein [Patescibacteria group bacterium]MDE2232673.1 hypothetical protein [Patescibacteria group bacterium]